MFKKGSLYSSLLKYDVNLIYILRFLFIFDMDGNICWSKSLILHKLPLNSLLACFPAKVFKLI
jgi:hypothetical protein